MVFTIRGLVRLQLISENYSRRLSIFRLFTQPGAKTEVLINHDLFLSNAEVQRVIRRSIDTGAA